ncbi:assembly factor 1 for F1 component of mitochondrial ATP synthase [Dunaliella salina]|uniref:Assembly factor 1 for F1 component of mitochondrial ATP synthase n=1 Tax=Dunaliella salina TaxID=3046 RepID=A0ABQ7G198_DUNSA|nr:assembly factor 1 for F1 component of mitochondrial ATP synthase [Dunaliella salina]|eukprot:KAF5828377.1 assembly factor 1 for F1 component of mitochondrial ATP synthase [Dunaliella salina]
MQPLWKSLRSSIRGSWTKLQAQHARSFSVPGISQTSPSHLHQVVKLEELENKTTEEISAIWLQYHADVADNRVASVMSAEEWTLLQERGKKSPMFVLPVAKPGGGFLTMVTQMQLPFTLVTLLEEYKRNGPGAAACMVVTHYPELSQSKKVVLTRGDLLDPKQVPAEEARAVLELLRAYYTDHEDYKAVFDFNHNPMRFDFNALLSKSGLKPLA